MAVYEMSNLKWKSKCTSPFSTRRTAIQSKSKYSVHDQINFKMIF